LQITLVAAFAVSCGLSLALTPLVTRFARRHDLVDRPEPRRVHQVPTPRLGGIVLFAAFSCGLILTFFMPVERYQVEVQRLVLLLAGATIITGVMVCDDLWNLPALPKLLAQVVVAGLVVVPRLFGPDLGIVIEDFASPFGGTVYLPLVVALPFTLLWIVGMMNTLNWVDGLDGLAAGITVIASAVLFIHTFFPPVSQFTISLLPLILGAAVLGFLPFNFHPARIFMGDSGAMFLGFTLAVVSIIGGAKIATALLALGVPILDVAWVIIYRLYRGQSPLSADRGHLHHRLLDIGLTQPQIVLLFYLLCAGFGALALFLPSGVTKLYALLGMAIVLAAILVYVSRREFDRSAKREASLR
jgi:UDP-GlcNAc:undecaprenyl-phosphate/decaprenyl-phosphate GlcNAc-1-phosphate transferase